MDSPENADASEKWFGQSPATDNGTTIATTWGMAALILIVAAATAVWAVASSASAREDAENALDGSHDSLNKYLDQVDFDSVSNFDIMDLVTSVIKGQTNMMN